MRTLHSREHTLAEMRVWTKGMADVGQFEIIERAELARFNAMLRKLNLGRIIVHHDDCVGLTNDCGCPLLS